MNLNAQTAVRVAAERKAEAERIAREVKERRAAKVARLSTAIVLGVAMIAAAYLADPDEGMDLPEPNVMVVAWTGQHWCQAYVDSAGEFRRAEDGTLVGQVTKWTKP